MSKVCCVDANPDNAVHHPGFSFREKSGARLQHFFDAKSVCGDSQVLVDDLPYCIVAIDLRESWIDEIAARADLRLPMPMPPTSARTAMLGFAWILQEKASSNETTLPTQHDSLQERAINPSTKPSLPTTTSEKSHALPTTSQPASRLVVWNWAFHLELLRHTLVEKNYSFHETRKRGGKGWAMISSGFQFSSILPNFFVLIHKADLHKFSCTLTLDCDVARKVGWFGQVLSCSLGKPLYSIANASSRSLTEFTIELACKFWLIEWPAICTLLGMLLTSGLYQCCP
jgi:hypothetical protein